jgi:phosphate-selective porin OprO/OprP
MDVLENHWKISYSACHSQIQGGEFHRWSVGANWYVTDQWRLEVNYGQGRLDRCGLKGDTDFLQFRLQWQF